MKWKRGILYFLLPIAVFTFSSYMTVSFLLKTGGTVMCPDVRGQKVEEAKRLLEQRGLSLSVLRYEPRTDIPYGYITVQKPEANITTRKGRVVNVLVSEGPQLLELPMVTNQTPEDAEAALKQKQVEVEKTFLVPGRKPGKVVAQIPGAGTKVLEGSTVVLFVGKEASDYYLMPDTKNADISALSAELDGKKIKYKISYGKEDSTANGAVAKTAATPARTIFGREDEIMINASGG
jgi:eukaryotic-like serine/threonine-protein kinase